LKELQDSETGFGTPKNQRNSKNGFDSPLYKQNGNNTTSQREFKNKDPATPRRALKELRDSETGFGTPKNQRNSKNGFDSPLYKQNGNNTTSITAKRKSRIGTVKDIVVLDLDETLVSAIMQHIAKTLPDNVLKTAKIFGDGELYVFSRPGLCEFLRTLEKNYTIVIWTAGTMEYGKFVNDHIITPCLRKPVPETLLFHRDQVKLSEHLSSKEFHKDLVLLAKMLGVDVERMFIIDNRVDVFLQRKPGNSIQIPDWVVTEDLGFHDRNLAMLLDAIAELI
jgi:TFIIF-interacting CTD phosphatase-like protein